MQKDRLQRGWALPFPTCPWGRALSAGLLAVLLLGASARSWAQEATAQEEPPPASVQDISTPLGRSFVEKPAQVGLFPWLQEQLRAAPPFFRNSKLAVNLRTYYFYRDNFDDTISEAWALGGGARVPVRLAA